MEAPLLDALEEHSAALRAASHLYVGFSGGRDSHCLLHALATSAQRLSLPNITAIHVHHGLHADADYWVQHCRCIASDLNVDLVVEHIAIDTDRSLEAQARTARYGVFEGYLSDRSLLLLAHHLDDQVETVLFRLLRGAGPHGLSGIPRSRSLGAGGILRPLLAVSRAEISRYAGMHALESIEDASNEDTSLDRNFLRHKVLPLIAERWPGYRSGIARTGDIMSSISSSTSELWYECRLGALTLSTATLESESLHTHIRSKLRELHLKSPSHDALKEFCRQCFEARGDKAPSLIADGYALVYWRAKVQLIPENRTICGTEDVRVGDSIERAWGRLFWVHGDTGLTPGSQVSLRRVAAGEKVSFPGRPGRSVRDCMKEVGIAPYWRASVPVVSSRGEVVAVPGLGCTVSGTHISDKRSEGLVPVWIAPKVFSGN